MAHFIIGNTVTIGSRTFRRTASVKINKSASALKDTAVIELPLAKGLVDKNNPNASVTSWLKEGQRVTVSMSYEKLADRWSYTEFVGYVKRIYPTIPAKIECQDNTYLMEKTEVNETFAAGTTIKAVVQKLVSLTNARWKSNIKVSFDIQDIPVEAEFRASNTNCLFTLDKIRSNYGLQAMFRGDVLYVGLAFTSLTGVKTVKLNLRANVADNDLVYTTADNLKLQITAHGFDEKGKKQTVVVPSESGDFDRKIPLVNARKMSKDSLANWANAQLGKKRYDGFTGSITCFLIPQVNVNDTVSIVDPENPIRNGKYLVEEIELTKSSGIRRVITLGTKL
jgi:hypothetical protein